MAGVLFIVIVPRAEYEKDIRKKENTSKNIEHVRVENTSKIVEELKVNRKFWSIQSNIESYPQDDNNVVLSKCKSTDCLHASVKDGGIQKSNSEATLGDNEKMSLGSEHRNYIKASWEEIKQTIKPRKKKLKITSRPKKEDVLATLHYEASLEMILSDVLKRLHIQTSSWSSNKDDKFWQVMFSVESGNICEEILQVLRAFGIGSHYQSSVSIIPCTLFYKSNTFRKKEIAQYNHKKDDIEFTESSWSRFASSVRARTNLEQVLHDVKNEATLTFDWLFLLIVAAFVAAIGLVENSTVILVASMLISPLMGPITAATLGTNLNDRSLQRMGVQHELLGLFLSLIIGFIFGLAICAVDEHYGIGDWPTYEMMSRCEIRSLWVGVLVAIPSGAGVALAVLGEYTASLVGVAISASLLPPAVNAGLLWAMSLVHVVFMADETRWTAVVKTSVYSNNQAVELAALGAVSLCLTLVNIICIFVAGVVVYKVKEVSPLTQRDLKWWKSGRESRRVSVHDIRTETDNTAWNFYRWCQQTSNINMTDGDNSTNIKQEDESLSNPNQSSAPDHPQNVKIDCPREYELNNANANGSPKTSFRDDNCNTGSLATTSASEEGNELYKHNNENANSFQPCEDASILSSVISTNNTLKINDNINTTVNKEISPSKHNLIESINSNNTDSIFPEIKKTVHDQSCIPYNDKIRNNNNYDTSVYIKVPFLKNNSYDV